MGEVKWIKIATQIFDNRKIRQIEVFPEGDAIIVIWFKLLCLAGNVNDNGMIYITEEVPYTESMLAVQFGKPQSTIELALGVLEKFGMIRIIDDILCISNWEKYQNIEGMERIREQNRTRKRNQRERERLSIGTSHVMSRDSHATDKEEDIEKEKERENTSPDETQETIVKVIDYLNQKLNTEYKPTNAHTERIIIDRIVEGYKYDDFVNVINKKYDEWHDDPKMYSNLNPSTLFGDKFEKYINQPAAAPKKTKANFKERDEDFNDIANSLINNL